jgi:putative protein kinase ArgK-like GTPase of G3E family
VEHGSNPLGLDNGEPRRLTTDIESKEVSEEHAMKLFRRLLLVLSVATAVVGILRVGGGGKSRVTTKQGGWRSYSPPE